MDRESLASIPPAFAPVESAVDLRPLTTSALIDRGFTLYRGHFAGLFLLGLLCQIAPLLHQIIVTTFRLTPVDNEFIDHPSSFFVKLGLILGLGLVAQMIVYAFEVILTYYIADVYLGKIPSVIQSMHRFTTAIPAALITCLLSRVLIALTFLFPAAALVASYFFVLFHPPTGFMPLVFVFGGATVLLVAAMAPVLVVFMRLWLTTSVVALEGLSGWKAVWRSVQMVRYDPGLGFFYWGEMRLSFLLLPLFIIELLIFSLTSLPLIMFQAGEVIRHGAAGQVTQPPDLTVILSQILTFLAISVVLPLYPIVSTLFYYDVRVRREGFDLEYMAGQLESRS